MDKAILLAVAASLCTATSSVCQRLGASRIGADRSGLRLIVRLARRPVWLAGIGCMILGFAGQVSALHFGALALVQPILALELLFVFAYMAALGSRRVQLRDWLAASGMSAGLGVFLLAAAPSGGRPHAPGSSWWLAGLVTAGIVLLGLAAAFGLDRRRDAHGSRRAAVLGAATGISWGFVAAVIKEFSSQLGGGVGAIFSSWPVYALIGTGAASLLLASHALASGPLAASQPGFTILDPLAASLLGVFLFGEHIRAGRLDLAAEAAGLALVVAGVAALSHSHLVQGENAPRPARPSAASGSPGQRGIARLGNVGRLAQTEGLTDVQRQVIGAVREFTDREIIPHAQQLEHADEYPQKIVDAMCEIGLFGLTIPEEYGGLGESLLTYALTVEEISRGWMSVSGIINTHFIVAYMLLKHGTEDQRRRYLPRMAAGELCGAFSMSEPNCGSDVSAIKTKAARDGDAYVINGQKMWLTNGGTSTLVAVLVKTDEGAESVYRNMTTFLVEKNQGFGEVEPGLTIPGKIEKMGYKGVDTTELIFTGYRTCSDQILGGTPGRGFYQMMDGVEVGRVNVAARGCGVALRAFELAVGYAQQRETFGQPIAQHQAIQFRLADMATKVEAAHQMMIMAARKKDSGQRNDLEAGMAKYLASEYCRDVVEDSFRIHGGYGFSKEYEIERLYREAPMLLIGEGTADIQKMIIGRRILEDYRLR